jgi:hypothetical protein
MTSRLGRRKTGSLIDQLCTAPRSATNLISEATNGRIHVVCPLDLETVGSFHGDGMLNVEKYLALTKVSEIIPHSVDSTRAKSEQYYVLGQHDDEFRTPEFSVLMIMPPTPLQTWSRESPFRLGDLRVVSVVQ